MQSHYARIVALSAEAAEGYLAQQDMDPTSRYYGGLVGHDHRYAEPGNSGSTAATLLSCYLCPEHPRFGDPLLVERAELLLDFLLREQHEDGTLDLKTTNFHDATMVGFVTQNLAYTHRLLSASMRPEVAGALSKVETFLRRGAEGMRAGGFHTPNHRWVLASALSLVYRIYDDDRYRAEAERYIAEGIDCTDEGEYTERSVGVYNVVSNRSLIIMAQELDRPELLDHVDRNLRMVLGYVEPDGTLFTLNSRRQDRGQRPYPAPYYENYLLMAHLRQDPQHAATAEAILAQIESSKGSAGYVSGALPHFLLDERLRSAAPAACAGGTDGSTGAVGFPTDTEFCSTDSQIYRRRRGLVSVSVLGMHEGFLNLQVGEATLLMRVHGTFYGDRGRFQPCGLEREGDELVLRYTDRWGYVRPLAAPPATAVWDELPHHERERVHLHDYEVTVRVRVTDESVRVRVGFAGLAGVLTRIEMILGPGGYLDAAGLRVPGTTGGWAVVRSGEAVYTLGADRIRIAVPESGHAAAHAFAHDMRGGQSADNDAFTVYATGITPGEQVVTLVPGGRCSLPSPVRG